MAVDDKQLFVVRRDLSGGVNNRQEGSNITNNQATLLHNVDIGTPGETKKVPGLTLIENLGNDNGYGLFGFEAVGSTFQLVAIHGTNLETWPAAGSFTNRKSDFTEGQQATLLRAGESGEGDVLLVKINGNNWFRMKTDFTFQDLGSTSGTGNDSPPDSNAALVFRNRLWILKNNLLSWSDPFPTDYSVAFNTISNNYRIPVGQEQALLAIRDQGIIVMGKDEIWAINPSVVPAATDKPEKLSEFGCRERKTAVQVGDDILYLASDGVRGLFRTIQDKVQTGSSFPISFSLKDEVDSINWAKISRATAVFFDNKYFLSLPVDASNVNNEVWVFFPAFGSWIVITGWNVSDWAVFEVDGESKLYAISDNDGKVYQAWSGFSNDGVAIDYDEQGRKEDFGQPLLSKVGGEVKIAAISSGSYNLTIQASLDDGDWIELGTMSLAGNSPTLPVTLPFNLSGDNVVREQFHLDALGEFKTIRIRVRHNALNGSDEIRVLERSIITYANEYQSE